jgi:hypothetical protein
VADKPCTLVLGGWGGTLCGLSTIDYYDARKTHDDVLFIQKQTWYHVRLRVAPIASPHGSTGAACGPRHHRPEDRHPAEMDLCQPLGIATWVTTGAIRSIHLTKLPIRFFSGSDAGPWRISRGPASPGRFAHRFHRSLRA